MAASGGAFLTGCDQPPPPPQARASGAGANSQHAIWISIIGGMLASTLVASLFVPLFFVLLKEASQRVRARAGPRSALPAHKH